MERLPLEDEGASAISGGDREQAELPGSKARLAVDTLDGRFSNGCMMNIVGFFGYQAEVLSAGLGDVTTDATPFTSSS